MNDLLKASDKTKLDHPIADLPLNETFWNIVEKNMTRGEIRETFLGDKGASTKPELQYIPSDPAWLQWQQMLLTLQQQEKQEAMARAQAEAQQQQVDHQQEMERAQNQREQEAHDMEHKENKARHAHNIVNNTRQDEQTWQEIGKQYGVGDEPANIDGKMVANPINNEAINPQDDEES